MMDDHVESGDTARLTEAQQQLKSVFNEIGDIIGDEAIGKLRKGRDNYKKEFDKGLNQSVNDKATNFDKEELSLARLAPSDPHYAEAKARRDAAENALKNSVEKAIVSNGEIDLGAMTRGVKGAGAGTDTEKIIFDKFGSQKVENLNKLRVQKTSGPTAKMLWQQLPQSTLIKLFQDSENGALLKALEAEKTWAKTAVPDKVTALESRNFI